MNSLEINVEKNKFAIEIIKIQKSIHETKLLIQQDGVDFCEIKEKMIKKINKIEKFHHYEDNSESNKKYKKNYEKTLIDITCSITELDVAFLEDVERLTKYLNKLINKFNEKMDKYRLVDNQTPFFEITPDYKIC